jgi:DNA polymerase-3 subunit beta
MKLIVSRTDLLTLINKIQGAVPLRPSSPILANVLIEAIDDQLIMTATDLMLCMRAFTSAKVVKEGAITLPARRLFQLVRELTTPQVEIDCPSPEVAFLNAGSSHFKLQGMHKNEYPTLPDLSEGLHLSLPHATLKEMLSKTLFSAAREEDQQLLNGVLFQQLQNTLTMIATDGKRLAKSQSEGSSSASHSAVLPLKAAEETIKILETTDAPVKITLTQDKFAVETTSVTLITKLLIGKYPDVSRAIPEKNPNPIILHREELISLLRQVSLFTSEQNCAARFTFTPGALHLSAMSGEIGEGNVSMPVNYAGPKLEAAFNPHHFLDILKHSKDETVGFSLTDPYNPGLVTDSSSSLFMIMPMRL